MRLAHAVTAALMLIGAASSARAEVQVALQNGRVTILAKDATVRQILSEWARVGQTKIVNIERIPGGPLTLQLTNVPETEALDLLLKSVSGYMAAPRPSPAATLSRYDRILVLPSTAIARVPVAAPPPAAQSPVFQPPNVLQQPVEIDNDGPSIPPARGPLFPTQPRVVIDNQRPPVQSGATSTPGVVIAQPVPADGAQEGAAPAVVGQPQTGTAIGTPRPGMVIVPPPIQPGTIEVQQPAPEN
jgi:hypothetical protein